LKSLLLILFTTFTLGLYDGPPSGIYIIKKPSRKNPCEQELKMLIGGKKICILQRPILTVDELEYITDILYDPVIECNHINVGLSSKGVNTLNQTISLMPQTEFALVVEGDVIGIFNIQGRLNDRFLRLGTDLDLENLKVVKNALKKVAP
jgi:hypothetical protein